MKIISLLAGPHGLKGNTAGALITYRKEQWPYEFRYREENPRE